MRGFRWKNKNTKESKKQDKTNGPVELDATDQKNSKMVNKKVKECKEMAIDAETGFQTDIQVEWLMNDKFQKFNIWVALVNIVNYFQS
eukprot:14472278-Ditylum_brightwellii.AAC.1